MKIGSFNENNDSRVAISPDTVRHYVNHGYFVFLENGYGKNLYDQVAFEKAGATFCNKKELFQLDIILQVHCPSVDDYSKLKDCILICFLNPFFSFEHLNVLASNNVTCFSMELVPRSSFAQKMDALSSQASLAGYVSVILAAKKLSKVFPMMVTPAGTIKPTKVLVIGAGVAGLQAIATSKRLGAQVSAFDTRQVAKEQVESLGAKFVSLDLDFSDQIDQGYANELSQDQLLKQQQLLEDVCISSDVIITTAQVFAKKAPIIIKKTVLEKMKKGSIVVDCAVDTGGNVEGVQQDKELNLGNVLLLGYSHLAQHVSLHASEVYSRNIQEFIFECFDIKSNSSFIKWDHEIVSNMLVVSKNKVVHPLVLEKMSR